MEILLGFCAGMVIATLVVTWLIQPYHEYPYSYHVAYSFEGGAGAMNVKRSQKIKTSSDVTNVREFIEKESKFEKVVITNWIALAA